MKDIKVNIRKRESKRAKNGFVYEYYFTYKGTRYSKTGFATEAKARKAGKERYVNVLAGLEETTYKEDKGSMLFSELANEFFEYGCRRYRKATIRISKIVVKEVERVGNFYHTPIKDITKAHIQDYADAISYKKIGSVKADFVALNRVFEYAIDHGYIEHNYCKKVVLSGNTEKTERKPYTKEEFDFMLNCTLESPSPNKYSFCMAMLLGWYCGLRVGEIFALTKDDVDFENKTISVNKQLDYVSLKRADCSIVSNLKSSSSYAEMPIPDAFYNDLKAWCEYNPYKLLVPRYDGDFLQPRYVIERLSYRGKQNGYHFSFHRLRHSYATNLVLSGVNIKIAQQLLRHASVSTTIDIYTHIKESDKFDAVNKVF